MSSSPHDLPTLKELKGSESVAPASFLSPEAAQDNNRLHGMPPPAYNLGQERPWHRVAAYLFATGTMSTLDVANACQVAPATVRNLLRQPWFQERVNKLLEANGGKDIMAILRAEQMNCMLTLIDLREDKKVPAAVRAGICYDILNRTLGKPVQRIETAEKPTSDDPVAEARRLKEEIARSRERTEET